MTIRHHLAVSLRHTFLLIRRTNSRLEQDYSKYSMPALRVDAQFTVIESTLKGYTKWKRYNQSQPTADLESNLESWCEKLLTMKFEVRFSDAVDW